MPQFSKEFHTLPKSIQNYLEELVHHLNPSAIILFGSRARGDHRPNSDFDIAVKGPIGLAQWAAAKVQLEEKNLTLHPIDLVILESLGDDYQKNIKTEGKSLYE
jgi:uncharacterized protein